MKPHVSIKGAHVVGFFASTPPDFSLLAPNATDEGSNDKQPIFHHTTALLLLVSQRVKSYGAGSPLMYSFVQGSKRLPSARDHFPSQSVVNAFPSISTSPN